MKNIPVFLCQGGTASLILREIPFSGTGYAILGPMSRRDFPESIRQCSAALKAAGAGRCLISSCDPSVLLPLRPAYDILEMTAESVPDVPSSLTLQAVSDETSDCYLRIYNQCFCGISHARFYNTEDLRRISALGQRAFLCLDPDKGIIGMGELDGSRLSAIGLTPQGRGSGRALLSLLLKQTVPPFSLCVSSDNAPALRLYAAAGFVRTGISSRWFLSPD